VVTLPVLGHAPGNLYRRIVAPAAARVSGGFAHGIINRHWPGIAVRRTASLPLAYGTGLDRSGFPSRRKTL